MSIFFKKPIANLCDFLKLAKFPVMGFYRQKTKPLDVAIFFASRQTF